MKVLEGFTLVLMIAVAGIVVYLFFEPMISYAAIGLGLAASGFCFILIHRAKREAESCKKIDPFEVATPIILGFAAILVLGVFFLLVKMAVSNIVGG